MIEIRKSGFNPHMKAVTKDTLHDYDAAFDSRFDNCGEMRRLFWSTHNLRE